MGYKGLQGVTNGLQEVTISYRVLQGVRKVRLKGFTGVYKGLQRVQGVTTGYKGDRGIQELKRVQRDDRGLQRIT